MRQSHIISNINEWYSPLPQVPVVQGQLATTAVYSRSSTAAGGTPAAPPSDPRDAHGALSLQATTKINYGVIVVDREVRNKLSYIVIIYNNL